MERLLDDPIEDVAKQSPEASAFRFCGDQLTYSELVSCANRLANWLGSIGVGPGHRVGIYMDKCLHMPIAVYGILKSGAAYVPLDVAAPPARTARIIDECEIKVLIGSHAKAPAIDTLCSLNSNITHIVGAVIKDVSCHTMDVEASYICAPPKRCPDDPAYILFTSGSTGIPKGIVHTHRSAVAYAEMAAQIYDLNSSDRMGNHSPLHFDMSTLEFFAGISCGACVILIPEMITKLPASLSQLIDDEKLTIWYSVPFALLQLVEYGALEKRNISSLRWIIFAGSPMSPKHLNLLQNRYPDIRFSNAYGPSEVNAVTYHHLDTEPHPANLAVPIGIACPHSKLEIGEDGELLVATTAAMEGYWKQDALTKNAFCEIDGLKYYKTGDLVACNKDGVLDYLGRKDRQVKIRGFRIELDEVELVLSSHEDVVETAVLVADNGLSLVAYATCKPGASAKGETLVLHARDILPAVFVPSRIYIIDAFERTATGKINHNVLRMNCA